MKKISEKLKKIIIDNVIALIISGILYFGLGYIMYNKILPNFQPLWFGLFFMSFGVFLYNLLVIVKVDNLSRTINKEWSDLTNKIKKGDDKE